VETGKTHPGLLRHRLAVWYVRHPDQKRVGIRWLRICGFPRRCGHRGRSHCRSGPPACDLGGATVIGATSLVVAPGFIDVHSHADFSLPVCPTADSLVHQGITTAVVGQCGFSPAPLLEETREPVIRMMDASLGRAGERLPWERWTGFKTYLLGIPTAFVTVAVPLAVAVIFLHLLAQLLGKPDPSEGKAENAMDTSV